MQTYSLAQGLAGFSLQVLFGNISQVFCVFTEGWNNNAKLSFQSVLTLTQSAVVMADSPLTHLSTTMLSCTNQKQQLLRLYSLWITTVFVCAVQMTTLIVSSTLLHDKCSLSITSIASVLHKMILLVLSMIHQLSIAVSINSLTKLH